MQNRDEYVVGTPVRYILKIYSFLLTRNISMFVLQYIMFTVCGSFFSLAIEIPYHY